MLRTSPIKTTKRKSINYFFQLTTYIINILHINMVIILKKVLYLKFNLLIVVNEQNTQITNRIIKTEHHDLGNHL